MNNAYAITLMLIAAAPVGVWISSWTKEGFILLGIVLLVLLTWSALTAISEEAETTGRWDTRTIDVITFLVWLVLLFPVVDWIGPYAFKTAWPVYEKPEWYKSIMRWIGATYHQLLIYVPMWRCAPREFLSFTACLFLINCVVRFVMDDVEGEHSKPVRVSSVLLCVIAGIIALKIVFKPPSPSPGIHLSGRALTTAEQLKKWRRDV